MCPQALLAGTSQQFALTAPPSPPAPPGPPAPPTPPVPLAPPTLTCALPSGLKQVRVPRAKRMRIPSSSSYSIVPLVSLQVTACPCKLCMTAAKEVSRAAHFQIGTGQGPGLAKRGYIKPCPILSMIGTLMAASSQHGNIAVRSSNSFVRQTHCSQTSSESHLL